MDKLIYTAFNTVNNIYDNRSVRAQNLANVNVPGFRRDLGTKPVGTAFLDNIATLQSRALPIRDDKNYFEADPGTLSQTDNDLDVAIRGDGYFLVKGQNELSLTRRGDLKINGDGVLENGASELMLNTELQPIQVPAYRTIRFADNGDVIIEPLNSPPGTNQIIGRLGMTFAADKELKKYPDGQIRPADGSVPQIDEDVSLVPQHMELSNVNITDELINSIEDQRHYEINIKLISSASEIDEAGASLIRMPS